MKLEIVLVILFTHWVADFVCQTDKMAQGKSKNWFDLLSHTAVYSSVFWVVCPFIFGDNPNWALNCCLFFGITFVCHTITDYFTSRLNSKLWAEKKVHWFFVSVGFDQFLHFAQLLITYQLLK